MFSSGRVVLALVLVVAVGAVAFLGVLAWRRGSLAAAWRLLGRLWARAPKKVRQLLVLMVGSTLVLLGVLLVVLPGPFTLPLVLAGLAVLSTEFVWAARVLERSRAVAAKSWGAVRKTLRRR